MSAKQKNIIIDIGTDFELVIRHRNPDGTPIDLTGSSFFARLREDYDSEIALADFVCTILTPETTGDVVVSMALEDTEILERTRKTNYIWDYKMIDSLGKIRPKLFGNVMVRGNASRADET